MKEYNRPASELSITKKRLKCDSEVNKILKHSQYLAKGVMKLTNNSFQQKNKSITENIRAFSNFSYYEEPNKEDLRVNIKKLELDQETNSDCILKQLNKMQQQIVLLEGVPKGNLDERDTLLESVYKLKARYEQEIPQLQNIVQYLKENVLEKLTTIEIENKQALTQIRDKLLILENSLYSGNKVQKKYSHTKGLEEGMLNLMEERVKGLVLKLMKEKKVERLSAVEKAILDLGEDQKELYKKLELRELDEKLAGKREAVVDAKLKEIEEKLSNLIDSKLLIINKTTERPHTEDNSNKIYKDYEADIQELHKAITHINVSIQALSTKSNTLPQELSKREDEFNEFQSTILREVKMLLEENTSAMQEEIASLRKLLIKNNKPHIPKLTLPERDSQELLFNLKPNNILFEGKLKSKENLNNKDPLKIERDSLKDINTLIKTTEDYINIVKQKEDSKEELKHYNVFHKEDKRSDEQTESEVRDEQRSKNTRYERYAERGNLMDRLRNHKKQVFI